jgi:hypothetical protein
VSPILVRPVREQFEHDRVIRVLQLRYKRKHEVAINPGPEQNASVNVNDTPMFPDLLLYSAERGRRLQATIEVETTESINTLEAMAEWAPFSRLRVPFYLYVPPATIDTVRRLCAEHQVVAAEIWTYHTAADQVRFTMVYKSPDAPVVRSRPAAKADLKPAAKVEAKAAPKAASSREAAHPEPRGAGKPKKPSAAAEKAVKAVKAKAAKSASRPAAKVPAKKAAKSAKRR